MKTPSIVLCAVALVGSPSIALVALSKPPIVAQQDRAKDFATKLAALVPLNASDEVTRLLKNYQEEAVGYIDDLASRISLANTEETEKEFQLLSRCWKDAHKSTFAEKLYEYHSELALETQRRKERLALVNQYSATITKFTKNSAPPGTRDTAIFQACAAEFMTLIDGFAKVRDWFYAARCASGVAICSDAGYWSKEGDLRQSCLYYGKTVEYFDQIDLKYIFYSQCKERWQALVQEGFGPAAAPDPNAPVAPEGPAPAPVATVSVTTAFEALKSLDQFQRPIYCSDELYAVWPVISLAGKGSSGSFMALDKDKGPLVLRPDSAKVGIDLNRDGTADKLLGMTGNLTVVDFDLGEGDEKRKWAFVFKTGIQDDTFQGLKTNLAPDDQQLRFYVMNAASVVTTINAVPFRVIDDNMDGVYGSAPRTYSYAGMSEGNFQPEYDCVVVGESKRARPWSQYQEVNGAWYEIVSDKSGMQLNVTPVQLETGTIRLDFKGPEPTWVILKGTGKLENAYFDIVSADKKPVVVPVGQYELFLGEVRAGKKAQTMKALIVPAASMRTWTVTKGAECVVQLGGPFGFDFRTEPGEERVTVKGKTVTITGVSSERYERTWNCVPRPEISCRKIGSRKGGKPEKFAIVQDLLETNEDGSYKYSEADTWRPVDTSVETKKGDAVEVQLVEKKNKLFGEIESIWK